IPHELEMLEGGNGVSVVERPERVDISKPAAEVLIEGELSPFEHEALYKLLKKHFRLEQPSYSDLLDETVGTRVNIGFHHPYERRSDRWQGFRGVGMNDRREYVFDESSFRWKMRN